MGSITGKGGAQGQATTTQTVAPYMYPYIGTALRQAGDLYGGGGPQFYPGQQVAGFSQPQQQAFSNIQSLAGSNPFKAATNFNDELLTGNFSGPEAELAQTGQTGASNPYLDALYGQAAGQTRNQLTGEFAGMGRNAAEAAPLRSEQLNNLATNLYGGAYESDQNRALAANQALAGMQQGAIGNAEGLANANLGLQDALAGVGGQVQDLAQRQINANQQKYNYYQQLPYQQLQQYEQFLQGVQPGMQQIAPNGINPTANALNMALMAQKLYQGYQGKGGSPAGTSG